MTDMLSKLRSLQRGQRLRFTPSLPKVRYLDRKGGKQKRVDAGGPEERLARRMQGKMIYEFIVPMICAMPVRTRTTRGKGDLCGTASNRHDAEQGRAKAKMRYV